MSLHFKLFPEPHFSRRNAVPPQNSSLFVLALYFLHLRKDLDNSVIAFQDAVFLPPDLVILVAFRETQVPGGFPKAQNRISLSKPFISVSVLTDTPIV